MPFGPGKYDDDATAIREKLKADGIILIVLGGDKGQGFAARPPWMKLEGQMADSRDGADDNSELAEYLAKRDALFRNPTLDGATALLLESSGADHIDFARPDVPLASVHRARLQWLDATDEMLAESIKWLTEHDYETNMKGAPPLTPERRDADRAALGKPLLSRGK